MKMIEILNIANENFTTKKLISISPLKGSRDVLHLKTFENGLSFWYGQNEKEIYAKLNDICYVLRTKLS
jgi:hypothetical protein